MPILYSITAYPPSVGGAQLHIQALARTIQQVDRVAVAYHWDVNRTDWVLGVTLNAPQSGSPPLLDGIPAFRIALDPAQRQRLRFWAWFYRLLQDSALDRLSDALVDTLSDAALDMLGTTPTIVHNSRVGSEILSMASLKLARRLHVPFVLTPNHHHHWKGWLYRHFLGMYQEADAVIAHTQFEREELIRLGVRPERIHIIGVGTILADSACGQRFREQHHIPLDAPMILFLGQKYAYKRLHLLLQAAPLVWNQFPEARFVFVGPRTSYSQRLFRGVSDPRIIETDILDLQTKTDALAACDIMCNPSAKESFGGAYVEAWALRKPVIGGDAPAVRELITDGETGYTVGNDTRLLAERITYLLHNPDVREVFGERGHQITQRYGWDKLGNQLYRVYCQLLGL